MLLTNYREKGDVITFPCILQEKVDGVRCLIRNGKGISRSGKELNNISHILKELVGINCMYQLDGELYSEGMTLYEISSLLNKKRLDRIEEKKILKIKLYVFDIKMIGSFQDRMKYLKYLSESEQLQYITFIQNIWCDDRESALELANKWIEDGKEGAVFRNLNGIYINGRSMHVQKYKSRYDDDFQITGYEISEGGCLIWKCITEKGFSFNVRNTKATGILDTCPLVKEQAANKIGEKLIVQYMVLDPISNIPREGVCIGLKIKN